MKLILMLLLAAGLFAQSGDWPTYNHDIAGTRYSPLTQISTKNVAKLAKAWSYRLRAESESNKRMAGIAGFSEATPLVVNGVMYLPAGGRIVALQPETGKEIWSYEPKNGTPSRRGVTYWPGEKDSPRASSSPPARA